MTSTSTRRGLSIGVSLAALCIAMPAVAQTTIPGIYQNVTGSDPDGGAVLNGTIRINSGVNSIHGTTNDTGAASASAYVSSAVGGNPGAVQQIVTGSNNAQGVVTVEGALTIQAIAKANNAAGNADATSQIDYGISQTATAPGTASTLLDVKAGGQLLITSQAAATASGFATAASRLYNGVTQTGTGSAVSHAIQNAGQITIESKAAARAEPAPPPMPISRAGSIRNRTTSRMPRSA